MKNQEGIVVGSFSPWWSQSSFMHESHRCLENASNCSQSAERITAGSNHPRCLSQFSQMASFADLVVSSLISPISLARLEAS